MSNSRGDLPGSCSRICRIDAASAAACSGVSPRDCGGIPTGIVADPELEAAKPHGRPGSDHRRLPDARHRYAAWIGRTRTVTSILEPRRCDEVTLLDADAGQAAVKLPAPAAGLVLRILEEMSRGHAVTIIRWMRN